MDFDGLVVRDGDLVTASGRLVRNQAGDWFEPPVRVAAVGGGPQMIRPVSPVAVRIAAADFDELAGRFEDDGTVEGFATLTGIWSAGQLHVQHQAVPGSIDARLPRWVTPPCPAPASGWPHHADNLRFDMNDLPDTGAVVAVTVFRPDPDQEVLVVAVADPDAAEAWLRPRLGKRLCVVASKWTMAELDAVRAHLHARHRAWKLLRLGQSTGEDGQACIAAELTRVLLEIASWAASLPAGIVSLDPWLRPAHRQPSDPNQPVVNPSPSTRQPDTSRHKSRKLTSAIQRMIDEYLGHASELRKHPQDARFGPVWPAPFGCRPQEALPHVSHALAPRPDESRLRAVVPGLVGE